MASSSFRGTAPPSGHAPPVFDVVAAVRNSPLDVTILDEQILGLNTHWVVDPVTRAGRTRLCFEYEGDCPHCGRAPRTWTGFLAVLNHGKRQRQVLRVGPEGARALSKWAERYSGLRGQRLILSVPTEGRQSALVVAAAEGGQMMPLPLAHKVDHTVCLVLGCQAIPDFRRDADELADVPLPPGEGKS